MASGNIGAGILNIITESLYDKPIVVFREYVQNAVDSFIKTIRHSSIKMEDLVCKIWYENDNLYFFDNGDGIDKEKFDIVMKQIALSDKKRTSNIGYKGIGRLSGISYCKKLEFVNILNSKSKEYQRYIIDCQVYNDLKKKGTYNELKFDELMDEIGTYSDSNEANVDENVEAVLKRSDSLFTIHNKGFLVILENVSPVLKTIIEDDNDNLITDLGWLLPVGFKKEMYEIPEKELFEELTESEDNSAIIGFNITYNGRKIERPIDRNMLRDYTCKFDLGYGKGFFTFRRDRIYVEKKNAFSGIRMYIDNMLLCDETELVPMLIRYGFLDHSTNELFQTVNAIGAMIYVTDKVSITANARRTFIEVTESDSLLFLEKIAVFIERVYKARYALSKYYSGKRNLGIRKDRLQELKLLANEALLELAEEEIPLPQNEDNDTSFAALSEIEQKRMIKQKITKEVNEQIKLYLAQVTSFDYKNAFENFKVWLRST